MAFLASALGTDLSSVEGEQQASGYSPSSSCPSYPLAYGLCSVNVPLDR